MRRHKQREKSKVGSPSRHPFSCSTHTHTPFLRLDKHREGGGGGIDEGMFQIPPHPHLKINMMPRKSNFATHVRFPDKVIVVSQEQTKKLFYSEAPLLSCLTPPPSTQPMSTATDSEKKLQQKIFFQKDPPRLRGSP